MPYTTTIKPDPPNLNRFINPPKGKGNQKLEDTKPEIILFQLDRAFLFKLGSLFCSVNVVFCALTAEFAMKGLTGPWVIALTVFAAICGIVPLMSRWLYGRRYVTELKILPGWKDVSISYYGLIKIQNKFVVPLKDLYKKHVMLENDEHYYFNVKKFLCTI